MYVHSYASMYVHTYVYLHTYTMQLFRAPKLYIFGKLASVTTRTSRETYVCNGIVQFYHSFHQKDLTKLMNSYD